MSSDLLQIGASGTRAYQAAMGAIADNIANAETPGYSRRTIALTESAAGNSPMLLYKSSASFYGVQIGGVVRASDEYLEAAARQTANALGSVDQRARWMTDIQTALNDGELGVGQRFSGMFAAVERLASNPTDTTLQADVLFSFEQINTAFQQSHGDLVSIRTSIGASASNEVDSLNDALRQLGNANEGLRRVPEGTASHASLLDSRDQALTEIAKRLNVTITPGANGVANINYDGQVLVENNTVQTVTVGQAADGILSFELGDGTAIAAPTGGSLGGIATSAGVVRDRIDALDDLATRYVSEMNGWHTGGFSSPGVPGATLLSMGADASEISLLVSAPALVARYSADDTSNGNLLAMTPLRGTGSIEDEWTGIVASHGSLTNSTVNEQKAASSRDTMAQQARAEVVGINLDREAADLIRLQQAYQASSRVIQVARELFQTIFSVF
ncbi:MAG: flagellar hook-associated protein FlgK [Alphaproteobacteria bacterium]|nr:flagellar hook-associated protein FlgK [Alphaproteobacteria bacterium]MBU0793282.1 flagellar hook-associated protein FlgK [Alphaproteobacteria bacterium]MBU0876247.1 flagellar hook-associated protein FlgK [Alphaproteobacteria bacterium]MBU1768172.1 flagellar hook-associated protein FlgK [Alphaproteobacteria bacterium]